MQEIMRNIVNCESVQDLLAEIREERLVTQEKYIEICNLIQEKINSDPEVFLLEPVEVAALIEEAIMIHSTKKKGTNFHVVSLTDSVDLAFAKIVGTENEGYTIIQYKD